ncbi:hypothetical protein BGX23_001928, partial [Mortierella sp. AD031]
SVHSTHIHAMETQAQVSGIRTMGSEIDSQPEVPETGSAEYELFKGMSLAAALTP